MTDKRILQLEEATDLTGASFLVAKEDVNQKIGVAGMKEHLGINSNSPIESPEFTGDPKAPTPDVGDNDTSIATTEFATTLADMRSTVQGMVNLGVSVLPNGGNLLIAVKQADGTTDASEAQPIILPFRVTAALGDWEIKKIEDALDFSVVSGATLGQTNGVAATVYVYLVNIAGTLELAVAGTDFGTSGLVATTTAMTDGADSASVMYSTTVSATPVPFLKIAEADNTQATAGTWATQPTPIRLAPFGVAETSWFKALKAATSVTNAMLSTMAQATIKGRASGAGTGVPTDLTGAQVAAILGTLIDAIDGLTPAAGSFIRFASSTTAVMQAIVGTVSQSGGVATGAIIEQGSNANGDYIRLASGWQICISPHIVTTPTGVTAIEGSTWTYPAAFASLITSFAGAPGSAGATSGAGTTRDMGVWAPATVTTTSLVPRFLGSGGWTVNAANTLTFAFIAIGKWF